MLPGEQLAWRTAGNCPTEQEPAAKMELRKADKLSTIIAIKSFQGQDYESRCPLPGNPDEQCRRR
jgi:hypothetical protein